MTDLKNLYYSAEKSGVLHKAPNSPDGLPVKRITDEGGELHDPDGYIPDRDLAAAINTALILGRPLFVTGEPGTGKSELADHLAHRLGLGKKLKVEVKSTTTATDFFYTFDSMRQFRDSNPRNNSASDKQAVDEDDWIRPYISFQGLGAALLRTYKSDDALVQRYWDQKSYGDFDGPRRSVVLIDEVDKAPRDVPNDVLNEIERHYFKIAEDKNQTVELQGGLVPIIIFTSNSEKHLPDAFLRRCVYHHLYFPDINASDEVIRSQEREKLKNIVASRLTMYPSSCAMLTDAIELMAQLRSSALGLTKPPATSELLDWLAVLNAMDINPNNSIKNNSKIRDSLSTLVKFSEDLRTAETRVFSAWFPEQV